MRSFFAEIEASFYKVGGHFQWAIFFDVGRPLNRPPPIRELIPLELRKGTSANVFIRLDVLARYIVRFCGRICLYSH